MDMIMDMNMDMNMDNYKNYNTYFAFTTQFVVLISSMVQLQDFIPH